MSARRGGEDAKRRLQRITYMNLVVAGLVDGRLDSAEGWVLRSAAKLLDIDDRTAEGWTEMVTRTRRLSLKVPETKFAKRLCMDLMIAVCKADGVVRPEEMRMLKRVGGEFGLTPGELVRKIQSVTVEELTAATEKAAFKRPSRSRRRAPKRKLPAGKTATFDADEPLEEPLSPAPGPAPEQVPAAEPRLEAAVTPAPATRLIPEPSPPAVSEPEPVGEAGFDRRMAELLGDESMDFVEKEFAPPVNFDAAEPFEMPEMSLSTGTLAMPAAFEAPAALSGHESPVAAASAARAAAGPGRLARVYCWFRGEEGDPSGHEAAALHFLAEHTDTELDAEGVEVRVVYGGEMAFAMRPRDGVIFDFSFHKPGGITADDVILEGRCDCEGPREFALLLEFA